MPYNDLSGTLPELQDADDVLTALAANEGITTKINDFGGFRDEYLTDLILSYRLHDYNADLAAGKISPSLTLNQYRPIEPYGSSFHNYGAGLDRSPVSWPAFMTRDQAVSALGHLAPSAGLRWPNPTGDPSHFELAISLDDARRLYADYLDSPDAMLPGGEPAPGALPAFSWGAVGSVLALVGGVVLFSGRHSTRRRQRVA